MEENKLTYIIRGAIFKVYYTLGPGLLESIYVNALCCEFKKQQVAFQKEVMIPVIYEGEQLGNGYRLDLLIENQIIIEVKSVENLLAIHHKQLLTYLKISNLRMGILVNFNENDIQQGIFRKVNGY